VRWAPSVDDKQVFARHALEELEHFETVGSLYEELVGENLLDVVRARVEKVPFPGSWEELVIGALLFDRANFHQLRTAASKIHCVRMAERLLRDEPDHLAASEALAELSRLPEPLGAVRYHAATWLSVAQRSFDDKSEDLPQPRPAPAARRFARAERDLRACCPQSARSSLVGPLASSATRQQEQCTLSARGGTGLRH
jgi:hypothetical protein